MFTYHSQDSEGTIIAFEPQSTNTWNNGTLLEAYKEDIDRHKKGFITDSDGFYVYEYGYLF